MNGSVALDRALAAIAAEEFDLRRAIAVRKVKAGQLSAQEANAHLMPWLAIAARSGSDLPEIAEALAGFTPIYGTFDEAAARVMIADDLCPIAEIRSTLATARDAAIDAAEASGDAAKLTRARRLQLLAGAFNATACAQVAAGDSAAREAA